MYAPYVSATAQQKSNSYTNKRNSDSARVQLKESLRGKSFDEQAAALSPVQRKGGDSAAGVQAAAAQGVTGGAGSLPYADKIQEAFGSHDISNIQAYQGGNAAGACDAIGAEAYATGDSVAFKGAPTLHTAAHEAAHIVQQRAGVSLKGGVGKAGDPYEQHADAVADLVVQGKSAEGVLSQMAGPGTTTAVQSKAVQRETSYPTSDPECLPEEDTPLDIDAWMEGGPDYDITKKPDSWTIRLTGFAFDKDTVLGTHTTALENTILSLQEMVFMQEIMDWRITQILGHASPEGSDSYNYDLAQRRAEAVAGHLGQNPEIISCSEVQAEGVDPSQYSQLRAVDVRIDLMPEPEVEVEPEEDDPEAVCTNDTLWRLLDLFWAAGTGWEAGINLGGSGTIAGTDVGLPFDVDVDKFGVGANFWVRRQDKKAVFGAKVLGDARAEGIPSLKVAELPIGVSINGATSFEIAVDLGSICINNYVIGMLRQGDIKGAFWHMVQTAAILGKNTQLTVVQAGGVKADIGGEVGLDSVAKAGLRAGLALGVQTSMANPTDTTDGKVEFKGDLGPFVNFNLDFLGGENSDSLYIGQLAQRLLNMDLDSAKSNGANASASMGMRVAVILPKGYGTPSIEVGLYGLGTLGAKVVGQELSVTGQQEVVLGLPDIKGFIDKMNAGTIQPDDAFSLLPMDRIDTTLSMKLRMKDFLGVFKALGSYFGGITGDTAQADVALKLSLSRDALQEMMAARPALYQRISGYLQSGDFTSAILEMVTENAADLVSMFQSLDVEAKGGYTHTEVISTPMEGDITGASLSGGGHIFRTYKEKFTLEQATLDGVETYIRGLY